MINLRAEIVAGKRGFRHEGLSRTVCRILSLYNLTPLLQKLRETEGKDGEKKGQGDTRVREERRDDNEDRKTTRKQDRQDKMKME